MCIDWIRERKGRRAKTAGLRTFTRLQREIFIQVFRKRFSHIECYEHLRAGLCPELSYREYLRELRRVYRLSAGIHEAALWSEEADAGRIARCAVFRDPADRLSFVAVESELTALPEPDRAAVELFIVDGLTAPAVASELGLPNRKAVYNLVYRTLAAIRKRLTARGIERSDV